MCRERGECSPTALLVVNRVPIAIDVILQSAEDKLTLRRLFEIVARGGAMLTITQRRGISDRQVGESVARAR